MHRARAASAALGTAIALALCVAGQARPGILDNPEQVVVQVAAVGVPAGVPWTFELTGKQTSGPGKVLATVGDALAPLFPATVEDAQSPGVRYALDSVDPPLPVKIDGPTTITAHYRTEYLLTVATAGLGPAATTVRNGSLPIGKAGDGSPLQVWLASGAPLALAVDDPVAGPDWAFLQGLTPAPGASLTAPLTVTAGYATMPQLIDGALATGGIFGPNPKGLAVALKQSWTDDSPVPDVGQPSRDGGVQGSFLTHVLIARDRLSGSTARLFAVSAASVYREQICAPKLGRLRHALQYAWYSVIVLAAGGKPKPDC